MGGCVWWEDEVGVGGVSGWEDGMCVGRADGVAHTRVKWCVLNRSLLWQDTRVLRKPLREMSRKL